MRVSKPQLLSKMNQENRLFYDITGREFLSMETSNKLTGEHFKRHMDVLMSLRLACHASRLALSDSSWVNLIPVGSGPQQSEWLAHYDRASESLRTRQRSLLSMAGEPGTELCQSWSRSGMICSGMYFPLQASEQAIYENGSYSSQFVPTPTTRDYKDTPGMALESTDKNGAPRNRDDQLPRRIFAAESEISKTTSLGGMKLTLEFLCWLQGFPVNWLSQLRCALETLSARKSRAASPEQ